jgi:hypothetical protein
MKVNEGYLWKGLIIFDGMEVSDAGQFTQAVEFMGQ